MLLFLDSETSGLPKRNLPPDAPEQPWVVSIAAELCDAAGNRIAALETAIRANGRHISEGARAVHGVTTAQAGRSGIAELSALRVLCGKESFVSQASHIIGHGISFDRQVIGSVLARNGKSESALSRPGLQFVDTMLAVTPFCKLERTDGQYKWASLDEACQMLLGEAPRTGHHSAWDDLQRCKRLFMWLRERGAFEAAA